MTTKTPLYHTLEMLFSTIEIFPTEIYLELFRYFDGIRLYQTFQGINYKIDSIIRQAPVDFNFSRNFSLDDEYILRRILPSASSQNIRSLKFSVQTGVSAEILTDHLLCSFGHICSLTLYIYSNAPRLIDRIAYLANLNTLELHFMSDDPDLGPRRLVNSIFNENQVNNIRLSLNTLTIYFNTVSMTLEDPFSPATTTIQHLKVRQFNYSEFISILPCLPSVRSIDASFWSIGRTDVNLTPPLRIQMTNCEKLILQLPEYSELQELEYILKHTPNLKILTRINTNGLMYFNAAQWKFIIMKYCQKLQRIGLRCAYQRNDDYDDWNTGSNATEKMMNVFFPDFVGTMSYDDEGDCENIKLTRTTIG